MIDDIQPSGQDETPDPETEITPEQQLFETMQMAIGICIDATSVYRGNERTKFSTSDRDKDYKMFSLEFKRENGVILINDENIGDLEGLVKFGTDIASSPIYLFRQIISYLEIKMDRFTSEEFSIRIDDNEDTKKDVIYFLQKVSEKFQIDFEVIDKIIDQVTQANVIINDAKGRLSKMINPYLAHSLVIPTTLIGFTFADYNLVNPNPLLIKLIYALEQVHQSIKLGIEENKTEIAAYK